MVTPKNTENRTSGTWEDSEYNDENLGSDKNEWLMEGTTDKPIAHAPVYSPKGEDMATHLVDRDIVFELLNHESDFTIALGFCQLFLGAIIGIVGAVFLGESPAFTKHTVGLLIAIGLFFIGTVVFSFIFKCRAKKKKDKLLK